MRLFMEMRLSDYICSVYTHHVYVKSAHRFDRFARENGAEPNRYRLGEQDADLTPDGRVVLGRHRQACGFRVTHAPRHR